MSIFFDLLLDGENKYLEFKESYSKTMLKTISAFANHHNGQIIIGITDKGQIVGVESPQDLRLNIENTINDSIKPRPDYEVEQRCIDGKDILIFDIYKGEQTPYTVDNKAYKRSDTSTVMVSRHDYNALTLYGQNITYEELESQCERLTFRQLERLLEARLELAVFDENILKSLELIQEGHYNNAAALLADQNDFRGIGFDYVRFDSDSVLAIRDRMTLNGVSIIGHFEQAMLFYHKHINQGDVITGAYRESFEEVPEVAYREAVANAIVHRDYSKKGNCKIEIFDDRIEVTSIGGLPLGMSEKEYQSGSHSIVRNRIIADIFLRCGMVEKLGTGIRRIKRMYAKRDHKPEFIVYENSIQVILPRTNIGRKISVQEEAQDYLLPSEERLYEFIRTSNGVTRVDIETYMSIKRTKATELVKSLIEKKMVMKLGSGREVYYKVR